MSRKLFHGRHPARSCSVTKMKSAVSTGFPSTRSFYLSQCYFSVANFCILCTFLLKVFHLCFCLLKQGQARSAYSLLLSSCETWCCGMGSFQRLVRTTLIQKIKSIYLAKVLKLRHTEKYTHHQTFAVLFYHGSEEVRFSNCYFYLHELEARWF